MDWLLYGQLSLMMFLEFAVWGAWAPVLAAYLLGDLKLSGKQTGWVYAMLWLACIVSPFIGGQLADRYIATQWFLAGASIVGGVLLLVCAKQRSFKGLVGFMGVYSLLYAPTIPLVFSLMMRHASAKYVGQIRVWGTIGWIVAGFILALWRRTRKEPGKTSDCLTLAGILSLVMGALCLFLPHTPPAKSADPLAFLKAFNLLSNPDFLTFLIISFVVTTELQFYYVPTAQFLEDIGIKNKNVPAVMTVAQMAEILAMVFALGWAVTHLDYRWTLAIGVIAWPARYVIFALMKPVWLVVASLAFHGIGYTFFITAGQMYGDSVAEKDIQASVQALITVATLGLGNFLGTQFTGVIMDFFKFEGKFRWRPIFLVPCILTVACAIAFLALFKG
ncbi:MAG: MFS transporter [Planctomycetes bacterium]|nr:MFS transporter [Planctomycetota bacterium]